MASLLQLEAYANLEKEKLQQKESLDQRIQETRDATESKEKELAQIRSQLDKVRTDFVIRF